jgi:aldehyde:ferredoxin oxidoreductase
MVTGWPTTGADLLTAGARINTLKRLFNLRQGATRADDTLPPRLLESIDLEPLLDAYYAARGWRGDGSVPAETLTEVGLAAIL